MDPIYLDAIGGLRVVDDGREFSLEVSLGDSVVLAPCHVLNELQLLMPERSAVSIDTK